MYDAPDSSEGRVLSYVAALREALDPALGADPAISSSDDFYEVYRFILPGYNARPLEVAGVAAATTRFMPATLGIIAGVVRAWPSIRTWSPLGWLATVNTLVRGKTSRETVALRETAPPRGT